MGRVNPACEEPASVAGNEEAEGEPMGEARRAPVQEGAERPEGAGGGFGTTNGTLRIVLGARVGSLVRPPTVA